MNVLSRGRLILEGFNSFTPHVFECLLCAGPQNSKIGLTYFSGAIDLMEKIVSTTV